MNGYKTAEEYYRYLVRRRRARQINIGVSGTLMDNLPVNLRGVKVTKFSNAQPNPECGYRKKRKTK